MTTVCRFCARMSAPNLVGKMNKSLLAVLIGTLFATSAAADDLLQLYREARQTDPTLASAKAAWQATQEKVPQAQAGLLPTVAVEIGRAHV